MVRCCTETGPYSALFVSFSSLEQYWCSAAFLHRLSIKTDLTSVDHWTLARKRKVTYLVTQIQPGRFFFLKNIYLFDFNRTN